MGGAWAMWGGMEEGWGAARACKKEEASKSRSRKEESEEGAGGIAGEEDGPGGAQAGCNSAEENLERSKEAVGGTQGGTQREGLQKAGSREVEEEATSLKATALPLLVSLFCFIKAGRELAKEPAGVVPHVAWPGVMGGVVTESSEGKRTVRVGILEETSSAAARIARSVSDWANKSRTSP
ncbi:hypothetical protein PAXRUDRAFT_29014 [Paxillus rubicundulus Ve08.2h10]|uniref:Uncharacterized protein n=1 Tax=Paxillus rubicundulus Ve08.2h10 TaxID=930991 RepID=A0A0D0BXX9_9AGAM|nr:hypothetical protein PAXRUDRAFT_29014 [Paxillus rubicundulus Ve08.2h10]